jgi:hypothetical protein
MASPFNFIDFYIGYPGHPRFRNLELIEDDVVRVIVQKYEMIIFTNKGDLLGDPNFGANLVALLHETRLSSEAIEADIRAQISDYIPELDGIEHEVSVEFFEDPERHQEYMVIDFFLNGIEVNVTVT